MSIGWPMLYLAAMAFLPPRLTLRNEARLVMSRLMVASFLLQFRPVYKKPGRRLQKNALPPGGQGGTEKAGNGRENIV